MPACKLSSRALRALAAALACLCAAAGPASAAGPAVEGRGGDGAGPASDVAGARAGASQAGWLPFSSEDLLSIAAAGLVLAGVAVSLRVGLRRGQAL